MQMQSPRVVKDNPINIAILAWKAYVLLTVASMCSVLSRVTRCRNVHETF